MLAANLATNLLPDRWYVPVCLFGTVVLLGLAAAAGLSAADLGLGRDTLLPGLLWAAFVIGLTSVGYLVAASIPKARGAFADQRAMSAAGPTIVRRVFVAIPFGTVLLEETAFRGVLFGLILVQHGSVWAVAVTSVLFGAWHLLPARAMHASHDTVSAAFGQDRRGRVLAVLGTVAFTAAGGVVFALLRLWTDSLLPPAGLHWTLNGLGVAIAWWLARRPSGRASPRRGEANPSTRPED
jgi:membrane protease YdiL (CAAX protease family)